MCFSITQCDTTLPQHTRFSPLHILSSFCCSDSQGQRHVHTQEAAGPSHSFGWSLWPFSITGCLVLGGAQTFPLHSSAEAESPQPMALGQLPGVCPPASMAALLQAQHELKDSISRNLCCWIRLPGAAMPTPHSTSSPGTGEKGRDCIPMCADPPSFLPPLLPPHRIKPQRHLHHGGSGG